MKLIPAGYSIQTEDGEELGYARLGKDSRGEPVWITEFHGTDGTASSVACPTVDDIQMLVDHFEEDLLRVHRTRQDHHDAHQAMVTRWQETAANKTYEELRQHLTTASEQVLSPPE